MDSKQALEKYYENPIHCLNCGKIISILNNEYPSEIRRKKFCNSSCSAIYNNQHRINKKLINKNLICSICGNKKYSTSKICKNCDNKNKLQIENKTLGYFIHNHKYLASKCTEIRHHARKILEKSNREKVCEYYHNHDYNNILEVHHIKGILKFSEDSLIKEINDLSNIIYLCPNLHIMLERNLISLIH